LISTLSGTFTDADHRAYIAEHWVRMLDLSVQRIDAFRAARPEHPIVDVQYADLMRDPVGAVSSIYAVHGGADAGPLDDRSRAAMSAYVAAHPKGEMGVHGYDLAEFGLDRSGLEARFADYVTRYDVATEAATA
jgi:hypothetical protein